MRRLPLVLLLLALPGGAPAADESPPALYAIATRPGAAESRLYVLAGDGRLPAPSSRFAHLPDAVVRAVALRDGAVAVVADRDNARDLSFAAALLRVSAGGATLLADRVVHASRPLADPRGTIYVERGRAGRDPSPAEQRAGRLREDALTIDAVAEDGRVRTVYAWRGYATHLAALLGGELVVYRVGPGMADLIAVDPASGSARPIAPCEPFARDFSVDDRGRLVFASRDAGGWTVERLDAQSGAREVLWRGTSQHPAPHAWPGGLAAWNPDSDHGLALESGARFAEAGVDELKALSGDGAWAAVQHDPSPGAMPELELLRVADGRRLYLPRPDGERWAIAGFAGGSR